MGSRLAFASGDNYPYLALPTGLLYGVLQRPDNLNNPFGAVTPPISSAVISAMRNPYVSHHNIATSRGNSAEFSNNCVSSNVMNTGALLPRARRRFKDAAR